MRSHPQDCQWRPCVLASPRLPVTLVHVLVSQSLDWRRLTTFTSLGGLMVAPTLHRWYSWLHRLAPGGSARALVHRLALDQLIFAPLFIPSFMGALLVLEQQEEPAAKIRHAWWPALVTNWKLWVPAQLINFGVVPLHFQVLFANGVALCWNAYLSWASHTAGQVAMTRDRQPPRAAAGPDGGR